MLRGLKFTFLFLSLILSGCVTTGEVMNLLPGNSIHSYASKGDIKNIQKIIKEEGKQSLNSRDSRGNTPLMMAAYKGQQETVDFLVKQGANINLVNKDGENILFSAAIGNRPILFKNLAGKYPKLAKKSDYNRITPYMRAALSDFPAIYFVNLKDKTFYAKDAEGNDILAWAVGGGNEEVVQLYATRTGKHLDIDKLRNAWLANFDNPKSKKCLGLLTEMYCEYATNNKSFKPDPLDSSKFRGCKKAL